MFKFDLIIYNYLTLETYFYKVNDICITIVFQIKTIITV